MFKEIDKSSLKKGMRGYTLSSELAEKLVGYDVEDDKVIVHYKELPVLNKALNKAQTAVLAVETMIEFKKISENTIESPHPQSSKGWLLDRESLGLVTGSNNIFLMNGKAIADLDGYVSKKVTNFIFHNLADDELQVEIIESDEVLKENYKTPLMKRGNIMEPLSIAKYYQNRPHYIEDNLSLVYNIENRIGVSIDSLATDTTDYSQIIVEFKNPKFSSFLMHSKTRYQLKKYHSQLQLQMLIMGIDKLDFVVNYPTMKQIVNRVDLDMDFAVNALQTLKKYNTLFNEYLTIYKDLKDV
jgi:hypothetical protein